MNGIADKVLAYQFIRKLTTPFIQWPAYHLGLIDERGNFLKKYGTLNSNEKNALGYTDIMIINLKKWIARIPGGGSRLGTIAATLVLLNNKPLKEDFGIAGTSGDINGSTNSTNGTTASVPSTPVTHQQDSKKKKKSLKESYVTPELKEAFLHYLKIVEDGGAVGPAAGPAVNAASTSPTLTPGNGNPAVPPDNAYKRKNKIYTSKLKRQLGEGDEVGIKTKYDDNGPLYAKVNNKLEKKVNKTFSKFITKNSLVKEDTTLEYHDKMNPKIWNDEVNLKPEIRAKLMQIASAWAKFAKINPMEIKDIIFTGGNANYNYTPKSDIDLHLVINRDDFGHDNECDCSSCNINRMFIDEYLQDKKVLWTLTHSEINIYGYPVELYAQDVTDVPHQGQGVYSVMYDHWIQLPEFLNLHFESDPLLNNKVEYYMKMIDKVIADRSDEDTVSRIKEKIKNMRGAAIAKNGEFSFENLVFKELRNAGYLDKLSDYEKTMKDKALSLS